MDEHTERADDMLRAANLRRTHGRILLLDVLLQSKAPLSHDDIEERLPEGALDRVSIYRALDAFLRAGIVHKVRLDDKRACFEAAHRCASVKCHPHFTCTRCGSTCCLVQTGASLVDAPEGFRIDRQEIYLEGLCSGCAKNE